MGKSGQPVHFLFDIFRRGRSAPFADGRALGLGRPGFLIVLSSTLAGQIAPNLFPGIQGATGGIYH